VRLPATVDEDALRTEAANRRIALETMRDYEADDGTPTLLLGYAQMPEPTIRAGIRELAAAI
jgi:DNA-binding transcriptional MocR family regulator